MADHSKPTTSSTYSNFVTELSDRVNEILKGMDPATTSPTNVPTNAIRWTSASNKWQRWNGTSWADLSSGYALPISGVSVAATTLSASSTVSGTGFSTYLASPPAIGGTTPAAGSFTTLTSTGALTVATDCIKTDAGNKTTGFGVAAAANIRARIKGQGTTSSTISLECDDSAGTMTFQVQDDGAVQTAGSTSGKTSSPYNYTTGTSPNCVISAGGFFQRSTSSIKYKRDVQALTVGLAETLQLRPVTYRGKGKSDGDAVFGGLIAEEVDAIPGLQVFVTKNGAEPEGLAYGNMVALLINAIKEQQAHIAALETRISALEAG